MFAGPVVIVGYVPGETGPALVQAVDRQLSTLWSLLLSWLSDYPCIAWPVFLLAIWLIGTLLGASMFLLVRRWVLSGNQQTARPQPPASFGQGDGRADPQG